MRTLGELFQKKVTEAPTPLDEKTVFYILQKIVREKYGERGSEMMSPLYLRDGILGIKTKNPLWANELWLERGSLCGRVNKEIGQEVVQDLKVLH